MIAYSHTPWTRRRFAAVATTCLLTTLLPITGCGGGGDDNNGTSNPNTGRATVTVSIPWPDRNNPGEPAARTIPLAANSIRLSVRSGVAPGIELFGRVITRSETSATFNEVPAGRVLIEASAHATGDATGVALARAQLFADVTSGQTGTIDVSSQRLQSTIARVDVPLPNPLPQPGTPVTLTAVAYDAQNNVIPTSGFVWANSNPAVLKLTPQGTTAVVQPVGAGSTILSAIEPESQIGVQVELQFVAQAVPE